MATNWKSSSETTAGTLRGVTAVVVRNDSGLNTAKVGEGLNYTLRPNESTPVLKFSEQSGREFDLPYEPPIGGALEFLYLGGD